MASWSLLLDMPRSHWFDYRCSPLSTDSTPTSRGIIPSHHHYEHWVLVCILMPHHILWFPIGCINLCAEAFFVMTRCCDIFFVFTYLFVHAAVQLWKDVHVFTCHNIATNYACLFLIFAINCLYVWASFKTFRLLILLPKELWKLSHVWRFNNGRAANTHYILPENCNEKLNITYI